MLCFSDHAGHSAMMKLDNSREPSFQRSVTEARLQSYSDSSRLRAVETLVSTRSGYPKITSISLRYEGEENTKPMSQVCDRNTDCDRYQASFRDSPCHKKINLHIAKSDRPKDFGVNTSSTATSSKFYSKLISTQQKENSNSNKSIFRQEQKESSPSFVESSFQPQRQPSCFKTDERNYENLSPRNPIRKCNDFLCSDQKISCLGRKAVHPEIDDKLTLHHNHNKLEFSPKYSSKQESGIKVTSDTRISNDKRSPSPVTSKIIHKDQENEQFRVSVPISGTSNPSDVVSSRRNSSEDMKTKILDVREQETKKKGNFHKKALLNEKQKHLEGIFIHESDEGTLIGAQSNERENEASKTLSVNSVSTKHDRSLGPSEIVHSQTDLSGRKMAVPPLYENLKMLALEPTTKLNGENLTTNTVETESAILEELTQAADQILQAVNGYTDEESYRASSDEPDDEIVKDGRRRKGKRCGQMRRPLANLGTITEAPLCRKQQETGNSTSEIQSHKSTGNARKSQRLTKTRLGPSSSTSSMESFTREMSRMQTRALLKKEGSSSVDDHTKSKVVSSSSSSMAIKSGGRTARFLQRASSREFLLQTYASSSEDIASGVEGGNSRKSVVPRRTRTHNSSNNKTDRAKSNLKKSRVSSDSQPLPSAKAHPRKRDADINNSKGR